MSFKKKSLGYLGETTAITLLKQKGYRIIQQNFRCRIGEIDIIARDRDVLVFIEVRSNSSNLFGLPQESIVKRKQDKIRKVAQFFLQSKGTNGVNCRFDVIAVKFNNENQPELVEHIENAF